MSPSTPNLTPIVGFNVYGRRVMRLFRDEGFQSEWGVDYIHADGGETPCPHRHKSRNAAEACGKKAVRLAKQA